MPDFAYVARDFSGQKVSGVIAAGSAREAQATLAEKSLFPVSIEARTSAAETFRGRRVKPQLVATTYGQLAGLLRSGVPLLKSLAILRDQTSHPGLKETLGRIHGDVEEGAGLSEAMARHPRVFGEMAISMVRAGGEGGFLEEALERVADFTEKQEDLKGRTMGALAYPIFLGVIGVSIVTGLIIFIVPKFEELFARLRERGELPAVTEWLLWLSNSMTTYSLFVILGVGVGIYYLKNWLQTEQGRFLFDSVRTRLPVAGKIMLNLSVARFCRVLGTLLRNGVPILKSLDISADAAGNRVLSAAIREAAENISAGESLAQPLAASGHFPRTVVEMIAVAEESNNLERVLNDIADSLERTTWRQLDLMVRLLEPVMLLLLAGVVLVVVIALLLPVLKMSMGV
ncbi:MAG: type II secretion system F family protein [Pirellulales bacterium]